MRSSLCLVVSVFPGGEAWQQGPGRRSREHTFNIFNLKSWRRTNWALTSSSPCPSNKLPLTWLNFLITSRKGATNWGSRAWANGRHGLIQWNKQSLQVSFSGVSITNYVNMPISVSASHSESKLYWWDASVDEDDESDWPRFLPQGRGENGLRRLFLWSSHASCSLNALPPKP